jgi:hypothetical protein
MDFQQTASFQQQLTISERDRRKKIQLNFLNEGIERTVKRQAQENPAAKVRQLLSYCRSLRPDGWRSESDREETCSPKMIT